MRKSEMKKATVNELLVDYVRSYASLCLNQNFSRGTKQLSVHCTDLENELLSRGILTEEDIRILRL